ncbi:YoaK family protein [Alsobacter sp. R-9]
MERSTPVEEKLAIALALTLTGGYLDAFTWITHDGVLANAQTANVVLAGVHAAAGRWQEALRHLPPIIAFVLGVGVCLGLRDRYGSRVILISLSVEIAVLLVVLLLHVRLPAVAGTLGISFAAAMQTTSFAKVEGRAFSSVMTTGNLSRFAEALYARSCGDSSRANVRQSVVFGTIVACFAAGAAIGAALTDLHGNVSLVVPILLLSVVLILCFRERLVRPVAH